MSGAAEARAVPSQPADLRTTLQTLLGCADEDRVLAAVLRQAMHWAAPERGSIWAWKPGAPAHRSLRMSASAPHPEPSDLDMNRDVEAAFLRVSEPLVVRQGDALAHLFAPGVLFSGEAATILLMVPLTRAGGQVGGLALGFRDEPELDPAARARFGMLGDVAGAALAYCQSARAAAAHAASPISATTLDERLRHAQKMEAVGTLAGGIAHEYNNLLTAILGNLSLALQDLPASHPLIPGLRDALTAAERAADLTRQLLGFGRRTRLELRPVELRQVVSETLQRLGGALGSRIVVEYADQEEGARVHADAMQLGQVVAHLCVNARDAMPAGGVLRVSTHCSDPPHDAVVLTVSDTGEGMAPEILSRIYEPFFTTKGPERGTGLGLAVVHSIVEQHGGWIECSSGLGVGTEFRVWLPRLREGDPAVPA